jgi:uncharacterized membrane protein (DUF106 family)
MLEKFFSFLDIVFSPIINLPPFVSLTILSVFLALLITFLEKIFVRKNVRLGIEGKIEEIREKLTEAQRNGDKEKTEKLVKELMKINSEYVKHSFKLLFISLIVIAIFLPWLNFKYQGLAVATLPFSLPLFGSKLSWLYWYAFASLVASWIIKKLLE